MAWQSFVDWGSTLFGDGFGTAVQRSIGRLFTTEQPKLGSAQRRKQHLHRLRERNVTRFIRDNNAPRWGVSSSHAQLPASSDSSFTLDPPDDLPDINVLYRSPPPAERSSFLESTTGLPPSFYQLQLERMESEIGSLRSQVSALEQQQKDKQKEKEKEKQHNVSLVSQSSSPIAKYYETRKLRTPEKKTNKKEEEKEKETEGENVRKHTAPSPVLLYDIERKELARKQAKKLQRRSRENLRKRYENDDEEEEEDEEEERVEGDVGDNEGEFMSYDYVVEHKPVILESEPVDSEDEQDGMSQASAPVDDVTVRNGDAIVSESDNDSDSDSDSGSERSELEKQPPTKKARSAKKNDQMLTNEEEEADDSSDAEEENAMSEDENRPIGKPAEYKSLSEAEAEDNEEEEEGVSGRSEASDAEEAEEAVSPRPATRVRSTTSRKLVSARKAVRIYASDDESSEAEVAIESAPDVESDQLERVPSEEDNDVASVAADAQPQPQADTNSDLDEEEEQEVEIDILDSDQETPTTRQPKKWVGVEEESDSTTSWRVDTYAKKSDGVDQSSSDEDDEAEIQQQQKQQEQGHEAEYALVSQATIQTRTSDRLESESESETEPSDKKNLSAAVSDSEDDDDSGAISEEILVSPMVDPRGETHEHEHEHEHEQEQELEQEPEHEQEQELEQEQEQEQEHQNDDIPSIASSAALEVQGQEEEEEDEKKDQFQPIQQQQQEPAKLHVTEEAEPTVLLAEPAPLSPPPVLTTVVVSVPLSLISSVQAKVDGAEEPKVKLDDDESASDGATLLGLGCYNDDDDTTSTSVASANTNNESNNNNNTNTTNDTDMDTNDSGRRDAGSASDVPAAVPQQHTQQPSPLTTESDSGDRSPDLKRRRIENGNASSNDESSVVAALVSYELTTTTVTTTSTITTTAASAIPDPPPLPFLAPAIVAVANGNSSSGNSNSSGDDVKDTARADAANDPSASSKKKRKREKPSAEAQSTVVPPIDALQQGYLNLRQGDWLRTPGKTPIEKAPLREDANGPPPNSVADLLVSGLKARFAAVTAERDISMLDETDDSSFVDQSLLDESPRRVGVSTSTSTSTSSSSTSSSTFGVGGDAAIRPNFTEIAPPTTTTPTITTDPQQPQSTPLTTPIKQPTSLTHQPQPTPPPPATTTTPSPAATTATATATTTTTHPQHTPTAAKSAQTPSLSLSSPSLPSTSSLLLPSPTSSAIVLGGSGGLGGSGSAVGITARNGAGRKDNSNNNHSNSEAAAHKKSPKFRVISRSKNFK
eukprot:TRINITY_DN1186_c0_g1_i3.p1 TRINITY_DN1186_c0_g1~~TRINITY_DN1186_c0_g1_i3.p1  ORF type:complete len:1278 (+),score=425.13 TRINITY_DN1186_c0_g1_i3:163-3996(+)